MKISLIAVAGLAAVLSGQSMAHHGDAGRFKEEVTVLSGVVVALQLVNPHSSIILDVTDESGTVMRWQVEMGGPNQLANNFGWNRNTLTLGDEIQVTGRVVKSGAPFINLTERARIVLVDTCEEIFHSRTLPDEPVNCSSR